MAQRSYVTVVDTSNTSPAVESTDSIETATSNETDYMLMCSEFLATRHENVNLLRLFRELVLRRSGLPEYKLIKSLSDWEAEFKKFTK